MRRWHLHRQSVRNGHLYQVTYKSVPSEDNDHLAPSPNPFSASTDSKSVPTEDNDHLLTANPRRLCDGDW